MVAIGNEKLMRRLGIEDPEWLGSAEAGRAQGQTVMFVAIDGEITEEETTFMQNWLSTLPWTSDTNIIDYEKASLKKSLDAIEHNSVENIIAHNLI